MNLRSVLVLIGVAAAVLILGILDKSKAQLDTEVVARLIAYQSNDDGNWEIYAERDVDGTIDTVQISPESIWGPYDFSEPIILGEGKTFYCAMLAHKEYYYDADPAYILVRKSTNCCSTWTSIETVGINVAIARHLRAAFDPDSSVIHVVWEDCRSGFWRIYYEKIRNP